MNAPRLELRQGQSLVMTQALQQSIKLLQCTSQELQAIVAVELEQNPFLTLDEPEAAESEAQEAESTELKNENSESDDWNESALMEPDYLGGQTGLRVQGGEDDDRTIDDNPARDVTLREHLLSQLNIDGTDPALKLIAAHLVDCIDDSGYLKESLEAVTEQLGAERAQVDEALALIQRFDPVGVGARDLRECLMLQLAEANLLDPAMQCLLDHLPLLAEGKFAELQKKCGVDGEDLRQMICEIKAQNPKPGIRFSQEVVQAIEPDVQVRRLSDGWHVELNMNNFPRVMVNKRYHQNVAAGAKKGEEKRYVNEQLASANWLIRALEQRAETLLKVSSELVKQQDAFFRLGVRYLKPMTLKDIAAKTGYHESTVSRVTTGKFLICPRGTFELKYFFTSGVQRAMGGGDDVSSAAVKHHISELIGAEKPDAILSDDELVVLLKDRNIDVARRTVAKYREALNIPSSPKRRRLKNQEI